jgi:hypothetical protein
MLITALLVLATPAAPVLAGCTVSAGTVITKANWRKYKDCFSDGIQAFWQGAYFWKISEDVEIHVGNPHTSTLPKPFIEASEKYGGQTRLVKQSDSR